MADQRIQLIIEAADKTKAAFGSLKSSVQGMQAQAQSSTAGIGASLQRLRSNWMAVTAATAVAVAMAKKCVSAFMKEEAAQMKLAVAMRNQGDFTREAFAALKDYAAQLQKATVYGDEVTLATMANLKTYGMTTEELKKATQATMDLATAKGMDLTAASELVGKAFVGETGTLSRYGIIVDEGLKKTEKFDAVLGQIQQRFGGSAQAEIETYAGQWKQIANWWGDIAEIAGLVLLKALEAVQFAAGMVAAGFYAVLEGISAGLRMLSEQAEKIPIIGEKMAGVTWHLKTIEAGFHNAKEETLKFTDQNYKMMTSFGRVEDAVEKMGKAGGKAIKGLTEEQKTALKELEKLRAKWAETAQTLRDEIASAGLDDFDKKLFDINAKARDLLKEFGKLPGVASLIDKWAADKRAEIYAEYVLEAAKSEGKIWQEGKKALEEMETSLTSRKASELEKRLLEVDAASKKERALLGVAYDAEAISDEEFHARSVEIRKAAAVEKKKIYAEDLSARNAALSATREADINSQLAELDIAEKSGTFHRDTIAERLRLMEELKGVQEGYLATLDKTRDTSSWYAQSAAIDATRLKILGLKDELLPVQASLRQFADQATDVWKNVGDAVKRTFDGMNEALVEFTMTGKMNFTDFANSVIRDFVRIAYQKSITGPLAAGIGGLLQGMFSGAGAGGAGGAGAGGGAYTFGTTPFVAKTFHGGGVVGDAGPSYRIVPALAFAGAPRFHGGLAPDEYPAVLQRGEGVFTPSQMKALGALTGGAAPARVVENHYATTVQMTVNALDSRSVSQTLAQHQAEIVGIVNLAYNKRGQRGPLGS